MKSHHVSLPIVAALVAAFPAAAQTLPDAGQTLQELQRPPVPVQRPAPTLNLPQDAPVQGGDGLRFKVQTVRLEGDKTIDAAALRSDLEGLSGKEVSLGDLRREARRLTGMLREAGYPLARVVLPAQEVRDGLVRFQLLEGNLGRVRPDNRSRVDDERLGIVLAAQFEPDAPLTAAALERTLLLSADLPGVGPVTGTLAPGDRVGTSDLTVSVDPGKAMEGELTADNFGNRYTGENRVSARLDWNSPTGTGDRVRANITATDEHLYYGRLAYDRPLGGNGLRLGAAFSRSQYSLGREFAALNAHGKADTVSLYSNYPIVRSRANSIWLGATFDRRKLKDQVDATTTNTGKTGDTLSLALEGDWQDGLLGGGANRWRLAAVSGRLSIDSPEAKATDAAGPRTAGSYSKWQTSFSRQQAIDAETQVTGNLQGQWAGKNLDSSEKFVLGGAYGVRAYPQGEGIGDEGLLANLELHRTLMPGLEGKLFYDWGQVRINRNPGFTTTANNVTLGGFGLGLDWRTDDVFLGASLAWRDRQSSVSSPDKRPRIWLQAGIRF